MQGLEHPEAVESGWLVLSRRDNEAIVIGSDIEVKIFSIRGTNVKVGVKAPKTVVVKRKELVGKKRCTTSSAAATTPHDFST